MYRKEGGPVRLTHPATLVTLLAGAVACRSTESLPPGAPLLAARGLEQVVRLDPAEPTQGQEVHIVSVVTNRATDSVAAVSRICGLDLAGDVTLVMNYMRCAGYSQSIRLAPGDSVTGTDMRVVGSPPGRYTLRVRQLLDPDAWVDVPLIVH